MPTIASARIPSPKSWDEFEDITLDASKLRWGSTDFHRFGRPGQKQNGVDIYGHDDEGRLIGIQCKNTISELESATIDKEITNAEDFEPKIKKLYIATTAPRDAALQRYALQTSAARQAEDKFPLSILFWEDICHDISKDEDIFFKHYPQFKTRNSLGQEQDRRLLTEYMDLMKSDTIIRFLDENNMAGFSFDMRRFEPLFEFQEKWDAPEREFLSPEIEKIRSELWTKADDYIKILSIETFPTHRQNWSSVPADWEESQPDRFWKVVNTLHSLAGQIVKLHYRLVRTARQLLLQDHA